MVDLSGKTILVRNETEKRLLIEEAIEQGYIKTGVVAPVIGDSDSEQLYFQFLSRDIKICVVMEHTTSEYIFFHHIYPYEDKCKEFMQIAIDLCAALGIQTAEIKIDRAHENSSASFNAKTESCRDIKIGIPGKRKVTKNEIEEKFGCPVEIVS